MNYSYPFAYKVLIYEEGKYTMHYGMGICESFTDAVDRIDSMYGNELIAIKHLELFEESSLIPMPKAAVEDIVNNYLHSVVGGLIEGEESSLEDHNI